MIRHCRGWSRCCMEGLFIKVRFHSGFSKVSVLERGLREGCPSSPVLFNIYHAAVIDGL